MASVPFVPPIPPPPSTSVYMPFNRALDLAHSIGVRPSIEVLKTLKVAKIEKAQDPRPKKRACITPRGKNTIVAAQEIYYFMSPTILTFLLGLVYFFKYNCHFTVA